MAQCGDDAQVNGEQYVQADGCGAARNANTADERSRQWLVGCLKSQVSQTKAKTLARWGLPPTRLCT